MNRGVRSGRAAGGFTLVELITVVAILGILVTLMVSAVKGVQNYFARQATYQMFETIDAALAAYYQDWGLYPLALNPNQTVGDFGGTDPNYRPARNEPEDKEAVLFAALSMKARHGPYIRGGAAESLVIRRQSGSSLKVFNVFADGWGRMIQYKKPDECGGTSAKGQPPVLVSPGPDEFDTKGEIKSYDPSVVTSTN